MTLVMIMIFMVGGNSSLHGLAVIVITAVMEHVNELLLHRTLHGLAMTLITAVMYCYCLAVISFMAMMNFIVGLVLHSLIHSLAMIV